jgi:putative ABC transport system permease protein
MRISTLAWKNIIKNPLNLVLNVLLFGLGIGLISFLLLFNEQLKDKFEKNLADVDLVAGAKGSPLQLILCGMYHIDNPTGNISVKNATPLLRPLHPLIKLAVPLSLGDNYKSYRIVGTNHDFLGLYEAELKEGNLYKEDFEVIIGAAVADETGLKIGDTFISSHGFGGDDDHTHDDANFKVTGILKGTGSVIDQLILTNTASIWLVHDHGHEHEEEHTEEGHVHEEEVAPGAELINPDTGEKVVKNSNEELLMFPDKEITTVLIQYKNKKNFQSLNFGRNINENTDMQAASPAIEINRLYSMIGVGTDALRALAILIAFVSAISIFISLYKNMRERKYELALMRVMGAGRSKIFNLVLLEGMILALIGFVVGTVLSHAGMELLAVYLKKGYKYTFSGMTFLQVEWILLAVSLIIGVIAALIPAYQAAKTDIHKTLGEK